MIAIGPELEAALLREVRRVFAVTNALYFESKLVPPVLALSDAAQRLGRWVSSTRTLELSRELLVTRAWPEVVAVLEHEMAHQYVDEVLHVAGEPPHGDTFQRVCAARGIDARAAGMPADIGDDGVTRPSLALDKDLERIRKLLALAGSANQHEAELAMKRAHELMLRHNLDRVGARCDYEVCWVGQPHQRANRVEQDILGLLAEFFFVQVIHIQVYVPRLGAFGRTYELTGTRPNLDMATHVYEFLIATAERLWQANRDDERIKNGRDRLAYQSGVVRGFREKLLSERVELKGTGLVWLGDASLEAFYRKRHPNIVRRSRSVRMTSAHSAGREAGRTVVLHKPVAKGGGGGRGLLGSGS